MKAVIVDGRISAACERGLLVRGFYPIKLPPHRNVSAATASHPDCLIFKYKDRLLTPAEYCDDAAYVFTEIRERFPNISISFTSDAVGPRYPYDAPMNALRIGTHLLCKTDTVSKSILRLAEEEGLSLHRTRQGYPACTVLPLDDRHAITADRGMAKNLEECNVKVTIIEQGGVLLPPHEYGFLGGAAGVYEDKVYFLGDYTRHPDAEKIATAIAEAGFSPVSLSDEPLCDLGGLIFID